MPIRMVPIFPQVCTYFPISKDFKDIVVNRA